MQEFLILTGIVIKSEPIGEYDRRVVILTKERGKISAFAKLARKPNSRLMAPTNPFSFGQFKLYEGRSSYSLSEAEITNYFEELRQDYVGAYYGMYFLEICDYYARENIDETQMLKLLYQALRALLSPSFDNRLVRSIFEIKAIAINGEMGYDGKIKGLGDTAAYTVDYIIKTQPEKLFSFKVTDEAVGELRQFCRSLCSSRFDKNFKSLEILENME